MSTLNYNRIHFLKSANALKHLPPDSGAEVAFAGRSNSGKSSALNAITGISGLARTSKTPGRTQLINLFQLDQTKRLVDLPGYGYAKVPEAIKLHWQKILSEYITQRQCLKGIILMMDIRHPLKALDWQMIEWATSNQLPIHILLTKADKLKKGAARNILLELNKELSGYEDFLSVQLFSAFRGDGIEDVHIILDKWFSIK
jgi:GTP-binding protein